MAHFYFNLLLPLAVSLATLTLAYCLGFLVFKKIKVVEGIDLLSVGISVLLGYGILGYLAVGWTFIAPLNKTALSLLILVLLILRRRDITRLFIKIKSAFVGWKNFDIQDRLSFYVFIFFFLFYLSSALIPPYQTDALAYHLPEARLIAQSGVMSLSSAGNLYGTSPILLESLYSILQVLSGTVLINLVHYQLLLAGLLVIYYFVREQFGKLSAQISIILIFSLYEVFVNAASPYIDAAMAAYQAAGMILILTWVKKKDRNLLAGAGILYGLALSIKYLSLYALALILPFIIYISFINDRSIKNVIKDLLYFSIPALVFTGFWYIKNLLLFGNPFYPFIFAHPGFTNEQIEGSNVAIKEFRPRTLKNFLLFPFILFRNKYYLTSLLGFFFLPLGFFWAGRDKIFKYILMFVFGYFTVWFFFISHQKRFAMIGLLFLMICFGYILGKIFVRYEAIFKKRIVKIILALIVLAAVSVIVLSKDGYFLKVKKAELSYVFGLTDKGQFYSERGLGEIYYLSQYINGNYSNTKFLPVWSDDPGFFLENGNVFISAYDYFNNRNEFDAASLRQFLKDNDIYYIIDFNQAGQDKIMKEWYNSDNPSANDYRDKVIVKITKISRLMPEIGEIIYNDHQRLIYAVR